MDEIKSALERALERADRMGRLSAEEMQLRKESEYAPIGEAIATRFLEHGQTSILAEQLGKLAEEGRGISIKSAITKLVERIGLENGPVTERALDGINHLGQSKALAGPSEEIMKLSRQYVWQKKLLHEEHAEEMEKLVTKDLARRGISGTAISGINLEKNEEWARKSQELKSEFEAQLEELKRSLRSAV